MRCSCGGIAKETLMMVEDDAKHGELVLKIVCYCEDCGRQFGSAQPFVKTAPTKDERAAGTAAATR